MGWLVNSQYVEQYNELSSLLGISFSISACIITATTIYVLKSIPKEIFLFSAHLSSPNIYAQKEYLKETVLFTDKNIFEGSYQLVTHFPDFLLWENRVACFK